MPYEDGRPAAPIPSSAEDPILRALEVIEQDIAKLVKRRDELREQLRQVAEYHAEQVAAAEQAAQQQRTKANVEKISDGLQKYEGLSKEDADTIAGAFKDIEVQEKK